MSTGRGLRHKPRVSYTISDDSDEPDPLSSPSSTFTTPQKPTRGRKVINLEDEDDEIVEVERPKTPPPRVSSAGHSLRQHKELHLSLRAQENGDKPIVKKQKLSKSSRRQSIPKIVSDAPSEPHVRTARNEVRDTIATETAAKRTRFFVAKKDYFLPLLPESNHVKKMVDLQHGNGHAAGDILPYEALESQPAGYVEDPKQCKNALTASVGLKQP